MESIWQAANADPNCDCYVVPIPYHDRNPDQSMGTLHYEGRQFPPEVPVVDYTSYDPRVRRPDIVYIHNPYDGYNLVTSVAPQFYSNELSKYTDMLVYIPYYVAGMPIHSAPARSARCRFTVTQIGSLRSRSRCGRDFLTWDCHLTIF